VRANRLRAGQKPRPSRYYVSPCWPQRLRLQRKGAARQPYVKNFKPHDNSQYNNLRFEDVRLDK
jgi:hypothetical protein